MNLSLEELIAQRAAVAQHLAWLDAKIAQLNAQRMGSQQAFTPVAPLQSTPTPPCPQPGLPATGATAQTGAGPADIPVDMILGQSSGVSSSDRAGCFWLVTLAAIGLLFLFIGVPYLWRTYIHKEPAEATQEQLIP
ncbi:MAG: hypothetical protein SFY80_06640 [Verrucomicrobiota bacterium]|nr:hypothetical protein [Verrucomicrobiota bacterium]